MSGTPGRPCDQCKWNDFATWLKHKGTDICLKCQQASEWVEKTEAAEKGVRG